MCEASQGNARSEGQEETRMTRLSLVKGKWSIIRYGHNYEMIEYKGESKSLIWVDTKKIR